MQQNSRFTCAIEADTSYHPGSGSNSRRDRDVDMGGDYHNRTPSPPKVQNSRFAVAAAEMEKQREIENREREERHSTRDHDYGDRGSMGGGPDSGPPLQPVNSRFAAAAAENDIVREREMIEREERRVARGDFSGGSGGGGRYGDRDSYRGGRGDGRFGSNSIWNCSTLTSE